MIRTKIKNYYYDIKLLLLLFMYYLINIYLIHLDHNKLFTKLLHFIQLDVFINVTIVYTTHHGQIQGGYGCLGTFCSSKPPIK